MKNLIGLAVLGLMFTFTSCDEPTREQSTVLEVDTVGAEYEVERTVKDRQVDVDTSTETETIEVETPQ